MTKPTISACLCALFLSVPDTVIAEGIQEIRFTGALTQAAPDGDRLLRQFEALLLQSDDTNFFAVLDDPREGCPWPESFGQFNSANSARPHLLYEYDSNQYNLHLAPLILELPENAGEGSEWTTDGWTYEIGGTETVGKTWGWKIQARERRGRRQSLVVSTANGLLLKSSQEVFMGQGERFELSLVHATAKPLTDDVVDRVGQLQSALLSLQAGLKRRPDSQLTELSARQVEGAASQVSSLSALARDTPLQETVLRISRDIDRQQRRVAESMNRRKALIGKAAPKFTLSLVSGGTLSSDSLKGKTVVLHFWKYSDKPLSEPYGQVGYLEFLYGKRKLNGVEVVGVATNPALQQPNNARASRRSARKLTEFMNLSYSIGYDDGSLLRSLGDPRENGGELPLWVVISPTGQIAHHYGGFYEVDQRLGLKALDDVLIEQIREN